MGSWALPLVLVGFWGIAQLDLDCAHKSRSRAHPERCRQETRQRFSAAWTKQFEVRCRASLT